MGLEGRGHLSHYYRGVAIHTLIKALLLVTFMSHTVTIRQLRADYVLVERSALESQHDWDHIGIAFTTQVISYGLAKKALRMNRLDACIFAFTATLIATSVYSLASANKDNLFSGRELGMNVLGAGLGATAVLVFEL